jgi:hypothetical protein
MSNDYFGKKIAQPQTYTSRHPTVTDDSTQGYEVSSLWTDYADSTVWICVSTTPGAASWVNISVQATAGPTGPSGGTGPTGPAGATGPTGP